MAAAHFTQGLAFAVDVLLFAVASAGLARWRGRLALVVWLLAADPLWTRVWGVALGRSVPDVPLLQALFTAAADGPMWVAFALGLSGVFGAAERRGKA